MLKIYLDQKDYGRIAQGILGNQDFKVELDIYNFLRSLVDSGKIVIYFSWCHLNEGLKWYGNNELLESYCEAVDNLTRGKCIINPLDLEKRELELYLAQNYNFDTNLSKDTYPYGKYTDAVFIDYDFGLDARNEIIKGIEANILNSQMRGSEKKYILRNLKKNNWLKQYLKGITKADLAPLSGLLPGSEIISEVDLITVVTGSKSERRAVMEKLFSGIFSFKNLIIFYRGNFPQLKQIAHYFDEDSKKLVEMIQLVQFMQAKIGGPGLKESNLEADLINKFTQHFERTLNHLSQKYTFRPEEAKQLILESKLDGIPSNRSVIKFVVEYYKKHKDRRRPLDSDLMDLHHLRNLPYVDFFLTDRFFTEVVKNLTSSFNTRVLRNLQELRDYLVSELNL